jgi:Baseplate J-like protein
MPSSLPLPTIQQLVTAASNAEIGERNTNADTRSGSLYNHTIGPMAILFSREADRDKSLFEDIYFNSASGAALTSLVQQRYKVARILDTYGQGTCIFTRPTATGGAGKFLRGTRVQVPGTPAAIYEVSVDTSVLAAALTVTIPIQAIVTGIGQAVSVSSGATLLDPIFDNTFVPTQLTCANGTVFEDAATYRARALLIRQNQEVGYLPQIILACQAAGAAYVLAFPSYYGLSSVDFTDDFGLNALYVADAAYQTLPGLATTCQTALEAWRVLGADLWIGGVVNVPLTLNFLVSLVDVPANLPVQSIARLAAQALLATFGPTEGGFTYSAANLRSAVTNASPYIQTASVPRIWAASTVYNLGDLVFAGGAMQQCIETGESSISIPAFTSTVGNTVFDGSTEWQCVAYPSVGIFAGGGVSGGILQLTDPTLSPNAWPASLNRYTLGMSNINFTFVGPL